MASLKELEQLSEMIKESNPEFCKLDRIDGLMCLTIVKDEKSFALIKYVTGYLKEVYREKGVNLDSDILLDELKFSRDVIK
jgi:hypothetical protein